jgi:hypothetical protein
VLGKWEENFSGTGCSSSSPALLFSVLFFATFVVIMTPTVYGVWVACIVGCHLKRARCLSTSINPGGNYFHSISSLLIFCSPWDQQVYRLGGLKAVFHLLSLSLSRNLPVIFKFDSFFFNYTQIYLNQ